MKKVLLILLVIIPISTNAQIEISRLSSNSIITVDNGSIDLIGGEVLENETCYSGDTLKLRRGLYLIEGPITTYSYKASSKLQDTFTIETTEKYRGLRSLILEKTNGFYGILRLELVSGGETIIIIIKNI